MDFIQRNKNEKQGPEDGVDGIKIVGNDSILLFINNTKLKNSGLCFKKYKERIVNNSALSILFGLIFQFFYGCAKGRINRTLITDILFTLIRFLFYPNLLRLWMLYLTFIDLIDNALHSLIMNTTQIRTQIELWDFLS